MENISHALCGAAIARAGFEDKVGKKTALITGALAANFADIDIITMPLLGRDHYMLWHRGLTHSVLALVLLPPLLAAIVALLTRAKLKPLLCLCYLAYGSHILMDLPTSWGTMLLLPFDDTRFSTHWVYIVDLFFWFILSLPFWLNRVVGEPVILARFSLIALALYVALCGGLHSEAVHSVEEAGARRGLEVHRAAAYPSPFLPIFWNGVIDDGQFLHQGPVQVPVGPEPTLPAAYLKNLNHPAVVAVMEEALGDRFINWWAESPVAEVRCTKQGFQVVLSDLRFRSPWLEAHGFRLLWTVKYQAKEDSYTVLEHQWLSPWEVFSRKEGDCSFRMERDLAKARRIQ